MKCFNILVLVMALLLIPSDAVITKPDAVLAKIDGLEEEVFEYQASIQAKIRSMRVSGGQISNDLFNQSLTIIGNNIKNISVSDNDISSTLAALNESACVKSLINTVDQIIELSGYAISNCIDLQNATSVNCTTDPAALGILDKVEKDIYYLTAVIVNAFIGRNVFTEGDTIVKRVQEQLNTTRTEIDKALSQIEKTFGDFKAAWDEEIKEMQTCFDNIDKSIQSAIVTVKAQIPICTLFGGRGARSAAIDPRIFFPQLN